MADWNDIFENHPAHQSIESVEAELAIASDNPNIEDSDFLFNLSRVTDALQTTKYRLGAVNPNTVSQTTLQQIHQCLESIRTEIANFNGNKNIGHMNNAAGHVDNLILHVSTLLVPLDSQEVDGIRESITAFRRSAGQNLRYLEEQSTESRQRLDQLNSQLSELNQEISNQKGRLDTAISQFQQQFSEAEERRRQSSTSYEEKREEEFAGLIEEREQNLSQFEESAEQKLSSVIENAQSTLETKAEQLEEYTQTIIRDISGHRDQAEKLLSIITDTGMVGGYQRVANEERRAARFWHFSAFISLSGLVGFAIYAFLSTLSGEIDWGIFAAKVFVSITFGIAAAYAARQADKHERNERRNRRMELELASVGPYLLDLPRDRQQQIKEELAQRLFGRGDSEFGETGGKVSGTAADLLKMALDTINQLTKK